MNRFPIAVVVAAQFLGTSLWFSANGVADRLATAWHVTPSELGALTSAVQAGFILGTLLFAISGLADRYAASRIFLLCALGGAGANAAFATLAHSVNGALPFRFLTGLALAGIYPVGMKLALSWAPRAKGQVLGWLVGMLCLGTALPHLLRALGASLDWRDVVLLASAAATLAGLAVTWLGDGAHHGSTARMDWGWALRAFRNPDFRAASLGYFGHMWELYAAWTLIPLLIARLAVGTGWNASSVSLLSFAFIAVGGVGCVAGGFLSARIGSARVAAVAMAVSALACLSYPWLAGSSAGVAIAALTVWGVAVVADSPQFSALAAAALPAETIGSALAVMNGLGFLITIAAIELTTRLWMHWGVAVVWLLAPGPLFGLWSLRRMAWRQPGVTP